MNSQLCRKRRQPMKKWSASEVKQILEYIQENGHFERPTAQVYYKKLLGTIEIDASWNLVKWKVRNLKRLYVKANDWKNTTGISYIKNESHDIIKSRILNICPHFENLAKIFNRKDFDWDEYLHSTQNVEPDPLLALNGNDTDSPLIRVVNEAIRDNSAELPIEIDDDLMSYNTISSDNTETFDVASLSSTPSPTPISSTTQKDELEFDVPESARTSTIEQLNLLQNVRIAFYEKKLELEKRKLELEERKLKAEIELKQESQRQHFEIEKLRLEKEERLAKLEIKMKYKTKPNF